MKAFFDIIIGVLIGILYNLIVLKFGEITNADVPYKLQMQRNLLLAFGSAALAFFLAQFVFNEKNMFGNRAIRYGLWIGMIILLVHVLLYNWHVLENDTKLIIMMISFVVLLLYSYLYYDDKPIENKKIDDVGEINELYE